MEKVWLESYPPGVPAEIDVDQFRSIGDLFLQSCRQFGSRVAFTNLGKGITFSELETRSAAFGAYLQGELKLPKGTRVAIMLPNLLQYPVVMFGALRAGYVVVNCNPLYTPRELEHQLKDSGAEAIVILDNFAHTLQDVLQHTAIRHVIVTRIGDMIGGLKGIVVNFVVVAIPIVIRACRGDHTDALVNAIAIALCEDAVIFFQSKVHDATRP